LTLLAFLIRSRSACGLALAALAMICPWVSDTAPPSSACLVAGRSSSALDVSSSLLAAPNERPEIAARCSAAEEWPLVCHCRDASTRLASSVLAAATARLQRSSVWYSTTACDAGMSSESSTAAAAAQHAVSAACIARIGSAPAITPTLRRGCDSPGG
jgi:hypothetical protein